MKINTQTIPSELAAAYAKLVSRKPTAAGATFTARTKPRATKKAPRRPARKEQRDYENAVDFLIAYLTIRDGQPPAPTFRAAQITAIKGGTFDSAYWVKCAEASSTTLENAPTSGAFVGVRNYAYPDPDNQPSTPTYGAGVPATGDPAYTGWTTAGTFADTGLRWIRKVFTLQNKFTRNTPEPLFLKLSGNITATANARPSRAMISAIIKRWIVAAGSARLTTTEAPIIKPISAFWRYKTPRGIAPYFALTKPLSLMYSARSPDYEELIGDLTSAVVLVAPMPMMGKRYNNNTSVSSSITATIELWQIKKGGWVIGSAPYMPGYSNVAWSFAFGGGLYCYLDPAGSSGAAGAYTSTDGLTWTYSATPLIASTGDSAIIAYTNGIFVAGNNSQGYSGISWTSPDGTTWTNHSSAQPLPDCRAITTQGNTFIATGGSSDIAYTSQDGDIWTENIMPYHWGFSNEAIAANSSSIIITPFGRDDFFSSSNGVAWSIGQLPIWGSWRLLAVKEATYCAISYATNNAAISTNNGATWTAITLPKSGYWIGLATDGNIFLLISRLLTNEYLTSPDGFVWTIRNFPNADTMIAVTFGTAFVVLSTTGISYVSTDGL